MKTLVYTAYTRGYDVPPTFGRRDVSYLAYSDFPSGGIWDHEPLPELPGDYWNKKQVRTRLPKLQGVPELGYDRTVWIDANVRLNLTKLLQATTEPRLYLYRHPVRSSVAEEEAAVIHKRLADPDAVRSEVAEYVADGFPVADSPLYLGSIIVRHNTDELNHFSSEWWKLYERWKTRDQLSLAYLVWKLGLDVKVLEGEPVRRPHRLRRRMYDAH